jgi:predicted acylesterase/phospholipase RssA
MTRETLFETKPRIKLALGGGGSRGLAHIGALRVLERHFEIAGIVGTSMGAIIGGLYAVGRSPDEILELARSMKFTRFASFLTPVLEVPGVFHSRGLREYFTELTGGLRIEESRFPYIAVSYDLKSRTTVLHEKGDLALAMRASSSLPIVFRPVHYGRHILVDGGIEHPLPVAFLSRLPGEGISVAVNVLSEVNLEPLSLELDPGKADTQKSSRLRDIAIETLRCNQGFLAVQGLTANPVEIFVHACLETRNLSDLFRIDDLQQIGVESTEQAVEKWMATLRASRD